MKLTPQQQRIALPILFVVGLLFGALIMWGALQARQPKAQVPTPTPAVEAPQTTSTASDQQVTPSTSATTTLDVAWLPSAVKLAKKDARMILAGVTTDTSMFDRTQDSASAAANQDPAAASDYFDSMWKLGTVTSGKYADATLYILKDFEPNPGGNHADMVMVSGSGKEAWYLKRYSANDYPSPFVLAHVSELQQIAIPSLDAPAFLTVSNGRTLKNVGSPSSFFDVAVFSFELTPQVASTMHFVTTTKEGIALYELDTPGADGCELMILPDGMIIRYQDEILQKDGKKDGVGILPDITWLPAYQTTSTYNDKAIGGCGAMGCSDVVNAKDVGNESNLVLAGNVSNGDPVYVPSNPASSNLVKAAYDTWYVPDGSPKPSLTEFVKKYPAAIVLWKNALGRWVRLTTTEVMPMAECGKPVIYLYPEKTTNVSVKLPSFINVTVSEPAYPTNGWNVVANPNGNLVLNGKTYDSLYWEGTGVGYVTPKEGFLIKDGEQDAVLVKLLAKYGLNTKESADFRAFWVPKMQGASYYRVSFLTSEWSKAAPLNVSPRPQSVIRIFMDWQKLSAPMTLPEPKIVTPKRDGFTLVEWGGLLY